MSTYNTQRPRPDESKARATDEARTFKKTEQVVGRPETTDHDFHEEYLRDPPRNVPADAEVGGTVPGMKAPRNEEVYDTPEGAMGEDPVIGRTKVADVQNDLIDGSETATREPPV